MKHAHKYFAALGVVLFGVLLYKIGPLTIWQHMKEANPLVLLLAVVLIVPSILARAIRWKIIVQSFGYRYSMAKASAVFAVGLFFSEITPGRAGDAVRAMYLKQEINSFGKALSTIFVDRLADIFITLALALYAVFSVSMLGQQRLYGLALLAILLLSVPFLALHESLVRRTLRPFYRQLMPMRLKPLVANAFNEFYHGIRIVKKERKILSPVILLTVAGWLLSVLQGYLVAKALHLDVHFLFLLGVIPLVTLISVIPVTISGLGIREGSYIVLLGTLSIASSAAVAFSLLLAFVASWLPALLGAMLWTAMPVTPNQAKNETISLKHLR